MKNILCTLYSLKILCIHIDWGIKILIYFDFILGDPDDLVATGTKTNPLEDWRDLKHLYLLNLIYDFTPANLVRTGFMSCQGNWFKPVFSPADLLLTMFILANLLKPVLCQVRIRFIKTSCNHWLLVWLI